MGASELEDGSVCVYYCIEM